MEIKLDTKQVLGSESVPDIFIDGYAGAGFNNGAVRLRLVRSIMSNEGEGANQAIGYLVMALPTLVGFHQAIGELIEQLQADGIVVTPPATPQPEEK